jgi:hypothetical protein
MRAVLLILVAALAGLLVVGAARGRAAPRGAAVAAAPADSLLGSSAAGAAEPARMPRPVGGLPVMDAPTRAAMRAELVRAASQTYLDSLMLSTDSLLRRWPDSAVRQLRVRVVEGGARDYAPRMAVFVKEALQTWETALAGVRFVPAHDSTEADISVRWLDRFEYDRAGQTDLTWDSRGVIRRATVLLALRTSTGTRIPDAALRAVAVHELGHALGLPHSPDSTDVMYPTAHGTGASERDRRTLVLLYRLPIGSLKERPSTPRTPRSSGARIVSLPSAPAGR